MAAGAETVPGVAKRDIKFARAETNRFVTHYYKEYKDLIDTTYPLMETTALGQTEFTQRAITPTNVINFLYLPADASRQDPEEQLKVSSEKDNLTVIIKPGKDNPEMSFQTFDANGDDPQPKPINHTPNTPETVAQLKFMLEMLKRLERNKNFSLVYDPKPTSK